MKKIKIVKIIVLISLALTIFSSRFIWNIAEYFNPEQIQKWLSDAGVLAPLLYMGVMMAAVVISPIPSLPLDIAAGAFFGPVLGTLYSVIGALAGAMISFMIARMLGRELIEKYLHGHINFCTKCSDKVLTRIVLLSRLLPVVSFDVISYGAGLTKMSLRKFSLATLLGMIPLTFLYNYSGSFLVFGKGVTLLFGSVLVIFFFVLPRWLEGRGIMEKMNHKQEIR